MKKLISSIAVATLLTAGIAQANTNVAQSGMTFSANVGMASPSGDFKADSNVIGGNGSTSNGNVSFGGAIGYDYAIDSMFTIGAEAGLQYSPDFAKISTEGSSAKETLLSVPIMAVVKFYIPNVKGLNVFAKGGIAYNNWKVNGSGAFDSFSENNWNGVAAGGVGYDIGNFNVFGQYTYNWLKFTNGGSTETGGLSTIAVGVGYKLPM